MTEVIVVVGSGPAGVAVAEGLLRRGRTVVLVEGGVDRERSIDRELAAGGPPRGPWGHDPLSENRRRVVGGTSTAWGGRCVPLDPTDFEQREWVPYSGWPISYEEYARWLPDAARLLEIPVTAFERDVSDPLLAGDQDVDGRPIEIWSPPTDVGTLLATLDRDPRLTVLRGTHVVGIETDSNGDAVALMARDGDEVRRITGTRFVLAAGALENARLLLLSDLADGLPALGRYYMSHVFANHMEYAGPPLPKETDFFRIGHSYARHRWQLTAGAQRRMQVGNAIAFIARPPANRLSVHLDPLTALAEAAKLLQRAVRAPRTAHRTRRQLLVYARVLVAAPPSFWPRAAVQALRRRSRNRLPMLLPPRNSPTHHLTMQAEHLPHPDSRVVLGRSLDRYGVPVLEPDIDFHRDDFATVESFHEVLDALMAQHGYSPARTPRAATREFAADMVGGFNSNAHHIGTTRMGSDRSTSVVDADCRVHGTSNLYVAGAAVFPTSGHANPTLSLVALACRLADHLAAR